MSANRLLAVFAHPDDESILAGGILAAAAAAGTHVTVVCATRGEHGPVADGVAATPVTLGEVREAELRAACAELGVHAVECLALADGALEDAHEQLTTEVARRVEALRPDSVLTFGPEGVYWHPDHVAVHDAVAAAAAAWPSPPVIQHAVWPHGWMRDLVATVRARGLVPNLWGLDPEAWGTEAGAKTIAVDVREHLDAKLNAIGRHASQLPRDHLFRIIPRDLAETYLGREHVLAPAGRLVVAEAA